ncbi:invasion associated locus B family protein [Pseudooceanicola onchidii]|uniref:invasion associated locus B family protein n=1 Tax=Pseudooceanicola onchidii TaxID=2562279 RepID=UPI00145BDE52|nr:invasion associated locus B family protein [Pseudooceanicola onchidii]
MRRLALIACFAAAPALSQEVQTHRDWSVLKGQGGCVATTSVGLKEPGSGLATLAFYDRNDAAVPATVTVRVPLGADLASDIAYTHAGRDDAVGLAWQFCDDRTCLASGAVSATEIARLQRGERVFLAFRPLPGSRALILPVSLMGFTRSWDAVQACD